MWLDASDFGTVGDGVTDDTAALQSALTAAEGQTLHIPAGAYLLATGSLHVSPHTVVRGDGVGRTILVQPNVWTYDRPAAPYVAADVVDWSAIYLDPGTESVTIRDIEARGPFYQADPVDYATTPLQNWPGSNGIQIRGREYQKRQGLTREGTSRNVRIAGVHVEGFGEEAIQADQVDNLWVTECVLTRCGRGGIRGYGVLHAWFTNNNVSHLFPGDYLNNGNRMYGIEATRVYEDGARPSEDVWISYNTITDCPKWKGAGTHGGRRIRFLHNDISECHHGIGVDKGGDTTAHGGHFPPSDITIVGNRLVRTTPATLDEGNGPGGPGHALFLVADSATNIGRRLTVTGNTAAGWGTDNLYGAMWLGNWDSVNIDPNVWEDSVGAAIRLRNTIRNLAMASQVIREVTPTSGGVHQGVSVETGDITGVLGPCTFQNTNPSSTLTALYLNNLVGDGGLTIQAGHRYVGNVEPVNIPANALPSPLTLMPTAVARVVVTGGTANVRGPRGVASVTYESVGSYLIELEQPASDINHLTVVPGLISLGRVIAWEPVTTSTFRIKTFTTAGAAADNSFSFAALAA